jgi:hypothetical protein
MPDTPGKTERRPGSAFPTLRIAQRCVAPRLTVPGMGLIITFVKGEMSMKCHAFRIVGLAAFLAPALFPLLECHKKATAWRGTLERRGDLTVVKNPKAPFHKAEVLRLEKDLSIGKAESDKEYVFSRIGGVDVDNEGNIYVLDVGDALVKVFGGQGKFLRAIGRKGQGPGETERPIFVEITRQEEVFVYDIHLFAPSSTRGTERLSVRNRQGCRSCR